MIFSDGAVSIQCVCFHVREGRRCKSLRFSHAFIVKYQTFWYNKVLYLKG